MSEEFEKLEIESKTAESFALCLALGTLEAIKSGAWSSETGIWTIRRPVFFEKLKEFGIPQNVLDKLDEFDEIHCLGDFQKVADEIEKTIKDRLGEMPDRLWYARWSKD